MSARGHDPNRDRLLDHEADGIREFDNALPRWWLYGFYFTIAFAAVYVVNYHVLSSPLFGRPGMAAEYEAELRAAPRVPPGRRRLAVALVALGHEASLAQGRTIFEGPDNVCSSCHRADLGGTIGPNLTDEVLAARLLRLSRSSPASGTGFPMKGMMPFGTGKPLTDTQLLQVASYVMARRGSSPADPKPIDPERDVVCR